MTTPTRTTTPDVDRPDHRHHPSVTAATLPGGASRRYLQRVGEDGWGGYLRTAALLALLQRRRGATGIVVRRLAYRWLLGRARRPLVLEDVVIRGPRRIRLGTEVMLEHAVTLDVKSARPVALEIGDRSIIRTGTVVDTGYHGWIRVGRGVAVGPRCELRGFGGLEIGDGALLAGGCFLAPGEHRFDVPDVPVADQGADEAPIRIGAGAWLGAHVFVGGGVQIGAHAVVGAGAVVTRDVPPGAVAAGVPARVLRYRPGFHPAEVA